VTPPRPLTVGDEALRPSSLLPFPIAILPRGDNDAVDMETSRLFSLVGDDGYPHHH
jgi:hypothetical protein